MRDLIFKRERRRKLRVSKDDFNVAVDGVKDVAWVTIPQFFIFPSTDIDTKVVTSSSLHFWTMPKEFHSGITNRWNMQYVFITACVYTTMLLKSTWKNNIKWQPVYLIQYSDSATGCLAKGYRSVPGMSRKFICSHKRLGRKLNSPSLLHSRRRKYFILG